MRSLTYAGRTVLTVLLLITSLIVINAQTTVFTYQGQLRYEGAPPTGTFDLEFRLSDSAKGGDILASQQVLNVAVTNGVFAAQLDFGEAPFTGQPRFLEIAIRNVGKTEFTTLSPRQQLSSAPYSIKAQSAAKADNANLFGGQAPSSFVQLDKNGNASIAGSLAVTGALSADTVNAQTQYELAGQRIISSFQRVGTC